MFKWKAGKMRNSQKMFTFDNLHLMHVGLVIKDNGSARKDRNKLQVLSPFYGSVVAFFYDLQKKINNEEEPH